MKVITKINNEFLEHLNVFKDWVFNEKIQSYIQEKFTWPKNIYQEEKRPEYASSLEMLASIDTSSHSGFPPDMYGLDFNYSNVKQSAEIAHQDFFEEIRKMNRDIDGRFQLLLGAYHPALKAYYPAGGYIAWHTNWNAPGYNIIFSYSKNGQGHWRHIDPSGSSSLEPKAENMVHIDDVPGWHCKAGYFGSKEQEDQIIWHAAHTKEERLTLSYVFKDEVIWRDLIEDIEDE